MKHVQTIRKEVSNGNLDVALADLDDLLAMGPSNLDALKLTAEIFAHKGLYAEEASVWRRIYKHHPEDEDAIAFFVQQQTEDREHFYFTDDLMGGARRYLAFPRQLVHAALFGLLGCLLFLAAAQIAAKAPVLQQPSVSFALFLAFVVSPWVLIVYQYSKSLRSITVSPLGIEIARRFRTDFFRWDELKKVLLAHGDYLDDEKELSLVLQPKDESKRSIALNLTPDGSVLRARSYFVRDISKYFNELIRCKWSDVNLTQGIEHF